MIYEVCKELAEFEEEEDLRATLARSLEMVVVEKREALWLFLDQFRVN